MGSVTSFASEMGLSTGMGIGFGFFSREIRGSPGQAFKSGMGQAFGYHGQDGFLGRKAGWLKGGKLGLAGRIAGPAFTAFAIYSGYKEGGVFGAAKGAASSALSWGAFEMGAALSPGITRAGVMAAKIALPVGIAAAAGYGYYKTGEEGIKHRKRLRGLEMGADLVDRFGTMTTMRQRSLAAIQNSHTNGRMALGSEALLLSGQYLR